MAERKFLHSWKDIATYTGRGIRTIQRYELNLGFPIHRPAGKYHSAVLAFSDEIDTWLSNAPKLAQETSLSDAAVSDQINFRRQYLAIAANARCTRKRAETTFQACERQTERVKEMLERMRARVAGRSVSASELTPKAGARNDNTKKMDPLPTTVTIICNP